MISTHQRGSSVESFLSITEREIREFTTEDLDEFTRFVIDLSINGVLTAAGESIVDVACHELYVRERAFDEEGAA